MKSHNNTHLNEEKITRAVIDEQELDRADRQHLAACLICHKKVTQIKD